MVLILDFPICSINFNFSLSSELGEVSQMRETVSPKSPSRLSPDIIGDASSEFVSSSIPSCQILTEHAQPFRRTRDLAFCLKVPLDSLLV